MSLDIDMESYGRSYQEPAAVVPPAEPNSYHQEEGEYVHQEFLDKPVEPALENQVNHTEPLAENINPQAENFRAIREELGRMKSEREIEKREHNLQMDIWRANQNQPQRQQEAPKRQEMFEGMRGDDIPNVEEMTNAFRNFRNEFEEKEAGYKARLEELQVQAAHPDYEEVIEKYAIPLVKQKPHLAEGLQGASNKALFAYELGRMAKQMQEFQIQQAPVAQVQQPIQRSNDAERMLANSRKPGTLSQAGGQSTLSKADYFATMSDQEFMKMATQNLEGI